MKTAFSNLQIGLIVCILLFGCRQKNMDKQDGVEVINIVNHLGKYTSIPASEFISELEYIALETGYDCLIGEYIRDIVVTATHIFVAGGDYCYAFNRDGKFINQIGSIGQGPGEYQTVKGLSVDDKNQTLYLETPYTLLEYSWDGVFHQSINIPKTMLEVPLDHISFVCDHLFIGHVSNFTGNEAYNFLLFNKSGQVVKSFDNHVKIDHTVPSYFIAEVAMQPFRMSESIYVKENWNDTLYCLNEQNELIIQYVFDLGKYGFTKEKRVDASQKDLMETMKGLILIPDLSLPYLVGAHHYLFFSLCASELPKNISFPQKRVLPPTAPGPGFQITEIVESHSVVGIYDTVNKKTKLLDTDPVSRMVGLINDLDGGLSFWPKYYTSESELVDFWQSYEMKEYLTEEYFAAHEIKDPQAHQKLKELLENLDWDDNPVIVIGQLK